MRHQNKNDGKCTCHNVPMAECPRNRLQRKAINHADRAAFTAAYMATVVPNSVEVPPGCNCGHPPYKHQAHGPDSDEAWIFRYHASLRGYPNERPTDLRPSEPNPAHIEDLAVFEYYRSLRDGKMQRTNPARQRRAGKHVLPKKARARR